MSKTTRHLIESSTAACVKLTLFMDGEIKLTETEFERLQDALLELLEETNNHRYRFGRTIPRSDSEE